MYTHKDCNDNYVENLSQGFSCVSFVLIRSLQLGAQTTIPVFKIAWTSSCWPKTGKNYPTLVKNKSLFLALPRFSKQLLKRAAVFDCYLYQPPLYQPFSHLPWHLQWKKYLELTYVNTTYSYKKWKRSERSV